MYVHKLCVKQYLGLYLINIHKMVTECETFR